MISVVIVSYRCEDSLIKCLNSLRCHKGDPLEIIVVDNNSSYDQLKFEKEFSEVQFLWNADNKGYAPAANQGAKMSHGEFLLFLNPDTQIFESSLSNMQKKFALSKDIGAVGPLSLGAGGWHQASYFLPQEVIANLSCDEDKLNQKLIEEFSGKIKKVKLIIGFAMMVPSDLFFEMGMMDEALVLGLDDLDFSWRLALKNKHLLIALDSYIHHKGQESFGVLQKENSSQKKRMEKQSQQRFSKKLLDHYNDFEKIPKSWDLWEIDWFTPSRNTDDLFENSTKTSCKILIHCQNQEEFLAKQKEWSYTKSEVIPLYSETSTELISLVSQSIKTFDLLYFPQKKEFSPLDWRFFKSSLAKKPNRYIKALQKWEMASDHQIPNSEELEVWVLPQQCELNEFKDWEMSKTPSDMMGSTLETLLSAVEKIEQQNEGVQRLEPSEIYLFSEYLKSERKKGRHNFSFEFENSLMQSIHGKQVFAQTGVNYYDFLREIHRAGYKVNEVFWENNLQEEKERWGSLHIETAHRSDLEIALSQSALLRVNISALKSDYCLDAKVSIIILGFNKVEYTQQCVESLQKYCRQNYELILVNNGSTDGTQEYFDSVLGAKVIHNENNLGVAAGWNQGMDLATGEYLLILNNDVIVPPNAIENLVRAAKNHPNAGIVAPRSNAIAGPQKIVGFKANEPAEILTELKNYQSKNDLSAWEFHRIKGFCMLIPREVALKVGYFDEEFGKGNFEDDDYSVRVNYSGYSTMVCDDSAIFHYGSVSFGQDDTDWQKLMQTNCVKFENKWKQGRRSMASPYELNKELEMSFSPSNTKELSVENSSSNEYLNQALQTAKQGKSEEAFRFFCLALEKDPMDEMVLKETIDFLNQNYSPKDCQPVLDYLKTRFSVNLYWQTLASAQNSSFEKSNSSINEPTSVLNSAQGQNSKSIKNDKQLKIEHELNAGNVQSAQALVNQFSGELDLEDMLMYQGLIQFYRKELDKAWNSFSRLLDINPIHEDALFNLFDVGVKLGHQQAVINRLNAALLQDDSLSEVRRLLEELNHHLKDPSSNQNQLIAFREINIRAENLIREGLLDEATQEVHRILNIDPKQFRALNNLGLIFWYRGQAPEARMYFKNSVEENPYYTDAIINLYDASVMLGLDQEVKVYIDRALIASPSNKDLLEICALIEQRQIPDRLEQYFVGASQKTEELNQLAQARVHLEAQEYPEAVKLYLQVLEDQPECAEAFNGLGIIAYYWGQLEDALSLFKQSLRFKLLDEDALLNYWDVAVALGYMAEARQVLAEAYDLDPSFQRVGALIQGA